MRVTNKRAQHYIELCPKDNGKQVNCYGCHYNEERYETCPSTWGSSLLATDLLEARELIKEMREVIQDSKRFHVNTLENGRDRIVSLGGSCDSVEDMERGDRLVRNANAILERTKEYQ